MASMAAAGIAMMIYSCEQQVLLAEVSFDAIKKQQQRRDGRRYAKQSSKAAGAETETKTKTQAQASNGHSPPLSKVP